MPTPPGSATGLDGESTLDVAYSLATTRAPLSRRAAVLAADPLAGLRDLASGADNPALLQGTAHDRPEGGAALRGPGCAAAWDGS